MIERRNVPCGSRHLCCKGDLIFLHPENGDVIADYDWVNAFNPLTGSRGAALKHKPNGDCIYLGDAGCTIHDRAPVICREFDCRLMYLGMTRPERRRLVREGLMSKDVLDAGRERVTSLEEGARERAQRPSAKTQT